MHLDSTAAQSPTPENPRPNRPTLYGPGRPRTLDDGKRREICALIARGCGLREAAQYVDCSITTIRREAERNPDFEQQLRHSEKHAQLNPLRAMQRAILTHWRVAAWFLERAYPDRFARHEPSAFGVRKARALMNELIDTIDIEILDMYHAGRIKKSIHQSFDRYIRAANDRRRNAHSFRLAMKSHETESQPDNATADLDIPTPDIDALMNLPEPTSEIDSKVWQDDSLSHPSSHDTASLPQPKSVGDSDLTSLLAYLGALPQPPE